MNIAGIYIITVMAATAIIFYLYLTTDYDHQRQITKLELIEYEQELKKKNLEMLRSKTKSCPIPNLETPRKCYYDSKYTCSWNTTTDRCEPI